MGALVGNLVVAIFGFSGTALMVLLAIMAIVFVFKAIFK
jgi:hypothetical protein